MNVVVFGSIPLAAKMLKFFLRRGDVCVVAVICERNHQVFRAHYFNEPAAYTIATENSVTVCSLEELAELGRQVRFDLGFSGRFNRIIPSHILSLFRNGIVNMHGGPLPQYRGVHGNIHAILNNEVEFGAALHFMDQGVDTGPVIDQEYFPLEPSDTGFDVFSKTQIAQWNLFLKNIDSILSGENVGTPQDETIGGESDARTYRKKDIIGLKELTFSMDEVQFLRRVRAFDFPGHEPCFIRCGDSKVFLRAREMKGLGL